MKEWKGNADAARSRIAVRKADHTTKGREQDDFYATDPVAMQKLLDGCSPELKDIFCINDFTAWECACGNGNLAECLKQNGWKVIASDLKDRGYGITGIDFLNPEYESTLQHIIITNPPYSLATEFVERAMQILPEGGVYIALMNVSYLASKGRYERLYKHGILREIYVFSSRVNCWRNNERQSKNSCMMVDYAWYVFQKGFAGQPTLYWL